MPIRPYVLKTVTSIFLATVALTVAPAVANADLATTPPSPDFPASSSVLPSGEQRYIVKYDNDVNSVAESQSLEQKGIEVKETLSHTMKASVVVATPNEIESLKQSEGVASVEKDTRVSITAATSIWGLDRVDQRTGRDGQYAYGEEGYGVNVYVIDTGLNFSHTDFSGRVPTSWWGIHDGRAANDCNGHGTHVAGTIAGTTYGVAKKANIIPLRALECDGSGWSSTIMAGIDWAVAHHPAGQPAVLNMSIGGFTNASFDQTVQSAVNDGITVVAAAGNDGLDACWASPARVSSAITVAATNINDTQVSWSNYGSCVDIQTPGIAIRSAWINAPTGYNTLDGTSMAAPHVAGAAAILLSRDRSLSPAQVHQAMIQNASTGVINGIRGATPNRMLFIPAPRQGPPSCANLQLGDAWAGVGTHCGLQGSGSVASVPVPFAGEAAMGVVEASATVPAIVDAPIPAVAPEVAETTPVKVPETALGADVETSVPVSVPAQQSPAKVNAPAPAQEIAAPSAPSLPAAVKTEQESKTPAPEVVASVALADDTTTEPATTSPVEAQSSAAPVTSNEDSVPVSASEAVAGAASAAGAPESSKLEGAVEMKAVANEDNTGWVITIGSVLSVMAALGTAYGIRKRKLSNKLGTPSA